MTAAAKNLITMRNPQRQAGKRARICAQPARCPVMGWDRISGPLAVSFVLVSLIAGCASRGDFGRIEPSVFETTVLPAAKRLNPYDKKSYRSRLPLSRDEERLRVLSLALANPAKRHRRFRFHGRSLDQPVDKAYERRRRKSHRSGKAARKYRSPYRNRAALLIDIENDIERVEGIIDAAARILHADGLRAQRLASLEQIPNRARRDARARLRENRKIIRSILLVLRNRIADYRLDLSMFQVTRPGRGESRIAYAIDTLKARRRELARVIQHRYQRRRSYPAPMKLGANTEK